MKAIICIIKGIITFEIEFCLSVDSFEFSINANEINQCSLVLKIDLFFFAWPNLHGNCFHNIISCLFGCLLIKCTKNWQCTFIDSFEINMEMLRNLFFVFYVTQLALKICTFSRCIDTEKFFHFSTQI